MQRSNEIQRLNTTYGGDSEVFPGARSKEVPVFDCKTAGAEPLHLPFTPLKRCRNTRKNYSGGVFNGVVRSSPQL